VAEQRIAELEEYCSDKNDTVEQLQFALADVSGDKERLLKRIAELEDKNRHLSDCYDIQNRTLNIRNDEIKRMQVDINLQREHDANQRLQMNRMADECVDYQEQIEKLTERVTELETTLKNRDELLRERYEVTAQFRNERDEARKRIAELEPTEKQLREEIGNLRLESMKKQTQVNIHLAKIAELERKIRGMKIAYNTVVDCNGNQSATIAEQRRQIERLQSGREWWIVPMRYVTPHAYSDKEQAKKIIKDDIALVDPSIKFPIHVREVPSRIGTAVPYVGISQDNWVVESLECPDDDRTPVLDLGDGWFQVDCVAGRY
jgi:chromosome segregation ATPase